MKGLVLAIFPIFLLCINAGAQELSNLRLRRVALQQDTIRLDSLSVATGSLRLRVEERWVDSSAYHLKDNLLIWRQRPQADSATLSYRVFPFALRGPLRRRDTSAIFPAERSDYIGSFYTPYQNSEPLLDFQGLDYNGSFSRGLSFGNRQSLVLNSNFNLQLNGRLGEDVELLAAISDNNLPLQPEGNTQRLQEFDQVYIQLKRNGSQLTAGDYELGGPHGYFMRYYKRLQGATVQHQAELKDGGEIRARASLAVSRGKFGRNVFLGEEGNQGPYRLTGAEGEAFVIVLAGTEKVYVDGRLLKRGQNFDYVVDYNRGTITFTSNRLITKDIRIIVEFEYATQQYLRTLYALNTEYRRGPLRVYANAYSEQDGRFSGEARNLSPAQRAELAAAGDAQDGILAPGARPADESNNPVLYKKVANPSSCLSDSIFVQAAAEEGGVFAVSFTELGPGQGHYRRRPAEAFGTVYEWVPPGPDCQPAGDYAPVVRLATPKQRQMYSAGMEYRWAEHSALKAELALSGNDLNRLSRADDADNQGLALFLGGEHREDLGDGPWSLEGEFGYEGVQEQFRSLNPYRVAEFVRDWNIESSGTPRQEHLGRAFVGLRHQEKGFFRYGMSGFIRDSLFEGLRHEAALRWEDEQWRLEGSGSWLFSEGRGESSSFARPRLRASKRIPGAGGLRLGAYFEQENNRRSTVRDSLNGSSFRYEVGEVFVENAGEGPLQWKAAYALRWDFFAREGDFRQTTRGENYTFSGQWRQGPQSSLKWNLTYRQLQINDTTLFNGPPQNTLLGRLEHRTLLWRGLLRSAIIYDIGSGQEQKVEFIYRPVQPGELGTHLWEDRNDDGQIQYEEVELPPFPEAANVVRITQFSEEFIRTENTQLNYLLRLEPRMLLRQAEHFGKLLRKFSAQFTLNIQRKARSGPEVQSWNPLQLDLPDTSLVALSSNVRTDLFFNRGNPNYDFQFSWLDSRSRTVLTTGFESRRNAEHSLRGRWKLLEHWVAVGEVGVGLQQNDSELFSARDYLIRYLRFQPQLNWQPSPAFRGGLTYLYRDSRNALPELQAETARQQDFRLDLTYNQSATTSLSASVSLVQIDYQGKPNTPISFALLNGLQNGRNFLWNLALDRRLANNIQLSFSYEGRQTGDAPVVHIGRAQVRAVF